MWLFTDKAFVSAVQSPTDPDMIVVRALPTTSASANLYAKIHMVLHP